MFIYVVCTKYTYPYHRYPYPSVYCFMFIYHHWKPNMTMEKPNHEWRCISYLYNMVIFSSNRHVIVFGGCNVLSSIQFDNFWFWIKAMPMLFETSLWKYKKAILFFLFFWLLEFWHLSVQTQANSDAQVAEKDAPFSDIWNQGFPRSDVPGRKLGSMVSAYFTPIYPIYR